MWKVEYTYLGENLEKRFTSYLKAKRFFWQCLRTVDIDSAGLRKISLV